MLKRHSLLLIEDDQMLGRLYTELLKESGYAVKWVQSAQQAVFALQKNSFHLILLDVMLPETSGVEFLGKLGGRVRQTVMLTNLDLQRVKEEVTRKGALGYVIKSDHTPDTFLSTISQYVQQASLKTSQV